MARAVNVVAVVVAVLICAGAVSADGPSGDGHVAVAAVLDRLHRAAAEADGEAYFAVFADGAVFLGTDASERWTLPEFRAFAEPYFADGRGWTYTPSERHIDLSQDGKTAWFDELLWNDSYGTCRGTGVLLRTADGWRIVQYHLTIPIPNELAKELTARIKAHGGGM